MLMKTQTAILFFSVRAVAKTATLPWICNQSELRHISGFTQENFDELLTNNEDH
jgi:hypothetical protein